MTFKNSLIQIIINGNKLELPESSISTFDEWIRFSFLIWICAQPRSVCKPCPFLTENVHCRLDRSEIKTSSAVEIADEHLEVDARTSATHTHITEAVISLSITRHQHPLTIKWFIDSSASFPAHELGCLFHLNLFRTWHYEGEKMIFQYFVLIKWMTVYY